MDCGMSLSRLTDIFHSLQPLLGIEVSPKTNVEVGLLSWKMGDIMEIVADLQPTKLLQISIFKISSVKANLWESQTTQKLQMSKLMLQKNVNPVAA